MSVLSGATASGRQLYQNTMPTIQTNLYTAPALNVNVTSPSATAYIKEIILCNTTTSPVMVYLAVGPYFILSGISIAANDTKVLTGLNTMVSATTTVAGNASAAGLHCTISGVEVQ